MCAWGHTCLIRDGYSGCVLGSVLFVNRIRCTSWGLRVPLQSSWFRERSLLFALLIPLLSFCFFLCCFVFRLVAVFCCVCSFVIMCITPHGLHFLHSCVGSLRDASHLIVSCDCLFPTCSTCVLVIVTLMLCICFSSDVIILLWYLCFGFRLHACICLFWCDQSCLVFVFWLFLMEHVIRYLSSSIAVACGHAFVSNECPMTSQRSNNLLVIMGSAVQNVFSHCHCSQPRKIRSSCTVWGARQGTDLCSHWCF